jgi:hypothetical protein
MPKAEFPGSRNGTGLNGGCPQSKAAISLIAFHLNLSEASQRHIITSSWIAANLSRFSAKTAKPDELKICQYFYSIYRNTMRAADLSPFGTSFGKTPS